MKPHCSGVILAGGLCSRFTDKNKAFVNIGGKRIIDCIFKVFEHFFEEIILVTNTPLDYLAYDTKIVTDLFPIRSSLTGLHAGLFYSTNPYTFFSACDTPFLKKELIEYIINSVDHHTDIIIPETDNGLEPLCAVYSKNCLKPIEQQLDQQKLKIQLFFQKVKVKKIPEKDLREKDHELISFFNINTVEDLSVAKKRIC